MNYGFNDDKEQVEVLSKAEAKTHSDVTYTKFQYSVGKIDSEDSAIVDINFAQILPSGKQVVGVLAKCVLISDGQFSPYLDNSNRIMIHEEPRSEGTVRYHLFNTDNVYKYVWLIFTLATTEKVTTSE